MATLGLALGGLGWVVFGCDGDVGTVEGNGASPTGAGAGQGGTTPAGGAGNTGRGGSANVGGQASQTPLCVGTECPRCANGEVKERCRCGSGTPSDGFCCNGAEATRACTEPDVCVGVDCGNGGGCVASSGAALCECPAGFTPSIENRCVAESAEWFSDSTFSADGTHGLGDTHTGFVTIEFDATPTQSGMDGVVAYRDSALRSGGSYENSSILVRMNLDGAWDARDGADYASDASVRYAANVSAHVRIEADLVAKTYDVWVDDTQIADDYAFRSSAPTLAAVGWVSLVSDAAPRLFSVKGHTVSSVPVCAEGAIGPQCYCGGVQTSGYCCAGEHASSACATSARACVEGAVTAPCECGGSVVSGGYCCTGSASASVCAPAPCPHGAISGTCICGGQQRTAGYCCAGAHTTSACSSSSCASGIAAFPGAEGFAACTTTGGRKAGTRVLRVTNLSGSANTEGSFPWAVAQSGPRIIVFAVSGVIDLGADGLLTLQSGDITIAGQTAPGGGITLRGAFYSAWRERLSNIVIRHMRFRPYYQRTVPEDSDVLRFDGDNIILDHVSVAWAVDESIDFYMGPSRITMQWSSVEANCGEGHADGNHNYGVLVWDNGAGGDLGRYSTFHHNLFANVRRRNPAVGKGPSEVINNVVYHFDAGFHHDNPVTGDFNLVGNYYRSSNSSETKVALLFDDSGTRRYYVHDIAIDQVGNPVTIVDDPWASDLIDTEYGVGTEARSTTRFDFSAYGNLPVSEQKSTDAYNSVLERSGAFPRDWLTRRHIEDVRQRTGVRDCVDSAGDMRTRDLMLGLSTQNAPVDTDEDGVPDSWESAHGLDPSQADSTVAMPSGYLAIEEYINERAEAVIAGN